MTKISVPTPEENETEKEFLSRCMGDYKLNFVFKENKVRAAVCYKSWNTENQILTNNETI